VRQTNRNKTKCTYKPYCRISKFRVRDQVILEKLRAKTEELAVKEHMEEQHHAHHHQHVQGLSQYKQAAVPVVGYSNIKRQTRNM
jgi:hypothetical protein